MTSSLGVIDYIFIHYTYINTIHRQLLEIQIFKKRLEEQINQAFDYVVNRKLIVVLHDLRPEVVLGTHVHVTRTHDPNEILLL